MKSVAGAPLMWIRPFSDIFQFISGVIIMIRINFAFRKIRINPPKTVRIKFSDLGVSSPGSLRGSSGVSSLVSAAHLLGSCQNWGKFRVKMLPWDGASESPGRTIPPSRTLCQLLWSASNLSVFNSAICRKRRLSTFAKNVTTCFIQKQMHNGG